MYNEHNEFRNRESNCSCDRIRFVFLFFFGKSFSKFNRIRGQSSPYNYWWWLMLEDKRDLVRLQLRNDSIRFTSSLFESTPEGASLIQSEKSRKNRQARPPPLAPVQCRWIDYVCQNECTLSIWNVCFPCCDAQMKYALLSVFVSMCMGKPKNSCVYISSFGECDRRTLRPPIQRNVMYNMFQHVEFTSPHSMCNSFCWR